MWILSILISISLILLLHVDDLVCPYLDLTDIVVNDVVRHDLTNNLTIVVGDLSGLRRLHHNVTELIVSYGLWRCKSRSRNVRAQKESVVLEVLIVRDRAI